MAELLNVQDLRVHFHIAAKGRNAVDGVSFSLEEGEILGLVGESGSGKSVTAMSISGLLPRRQAEVSGSIKLGGREILQCPEEELRKIQGDDLAVVFQEPMTSLNPVITVGKQIAEALEKPVVKKQLELLRLRRNCPAFAQGAKIQIESCGPELTIEWSCSGHVARLQANLQKLTYRVEIE